MDGSNPALAIVVVSYNSAAHLPTLLRGLLEQMDDADELVVVDNRSSDDSAELASATSGRVRVVRAQANRGFGAGCHLGARETRAPLLAFLNPDSEPAPECLTRLRAAASVHPDWGAWQAAVLMDEDRINTDGGVIHFTGIGWAGHCGAASNTLPDEPTEVSFPSGAATVIRRSVWDALGGFDPTYFLYCEDSDLGLRVWSAGHRVGLVPDAHLRHDYAFEKGTSKWFYLERNRLRTVLTVYPPTLLALLAPALVGLELVLLTVAARRGWLLAKLRANRAVLAELGAIRARRRQMQAVRRIGELAFARRLTSSLESEYLGIDAASAPARLQALYWAAVLRVLAVLPR